MKKVGYVDGYVLVVKKDKLEEYIKVADEMAGMWLKHGAIAVRECRGDDLTPDMGEDCTLLQFPSVMDMAEDETVWFSYIEYESREHRDKINKLVEADMTAYMKDHPDHAKQMPFDMKRMAFGGFVAEVSQA